MVNMTRHQLRAARALLVLHQEVLAQKAEVGVVTIRRFENGNAVGERTVTKLQSVIEAEGAVLIASGAVVDGKVVGAGVVLRPESALPEGTKARRDALDQTSEQAAAGLPPGVRKNVGRRSRVPPPSTVRRREEKAEAAKAEAAEPRQDAATAKRTASKKRAPRVEDEGRE